MIVSALQLKHVSTSNVKILAKMLVELALNVNQSTTVSSLKIQLQGVPSILEHFRPKKSLFRIVVETKSRSVSEKSRY